MPRCSEKTEGVRRESGGNGWATGVEEEGCDGCESHRGLSLSEEGSAINNEESKARDERKGIRRESKLTRTR